MSILTCIAPANIAIIKNWGKLDEICNLPMNDSIGVTLDTEHFCAKTTVMVSPDFTEDKMWLNGRQKSMEDYRLNNCIQKLREVARQAGEIKQWKIHICSENYFSTADGFIPSSAIEYVGLVKALASLYKFESDISGLVRASYGSACRSTCEGFVMWFKGNDPKGKDSIARTMIPSCKWSEMRILILVVNDFNKRVSTKTGMKATVQSSDILKCRVEKISERVQEMIQSIQSKDFDTFATLTMKDSNQMHAAYLDAFPPCVYLNDTSHLIIDLVHKYNDVSKETKVGYTFGSGPNATLFLLEKDVPEFIGVLEHYFPPAEICNNARNFRKGITVHPVTNQELFQKLKFIQQSPGKLKYFIHTKVGSGPELLTNSDDHLLNSEGLPKNKS